MDAGQFTIDVTARGAMDSVPVRAAQLSAYDAVKPAGKRKQPPATIMREDRHLAGKRNQLAANAADLYRNFAIAAWMVRKHLDYVARFNFQPSTGDHGFDRALAELMEWQSLPAQMDRGRRLTREKLFRLAEARRVLDGDYGLLRLRSGHVQTIKGDLIADPPTAKRRQGDNWETGVKIDGAGAHLAYALNRRPAEGRGYEFDRIVPADNFHLHGFFADGPSDQVRGISPLVSAIADFRDVYESIDYIKVKIKLAQLLGIAFTRKSSSTDLETAIGTETNPAGTADETCDDDEPEPRVLDWSKGVATFDLDEDEGVEVIESTTPSTQTQEFLRLTIMVALKSLDLPYSFFDEKHTNFHGSRGSWIQYDRSALDKRDDQVEMRRRWTLWCLQRWVFEGLLSLPSGVTVADIRFAWIPKGLPWWKPSEEVKGALTAIGGALDNPIRVCQEYDRGDVFQNIDRTLDVIQYAHEQGIKRIGRPLRLGFEAEFFNQQPPDTETPDDDDADPHTDDTDANPGPNKKPD